MRMAIFCLSMAFVIGCGSSTSVTTESKSDVKGEVKGEVKKTASVDDAPPKKGARDLTEYIAQLKLDTPIQIADFKAKKLKAVEYEANEKYPDLFRFVVIDVPRVYLKDDVTGKGQWHTRARLTLNNPKPAKLNSKGGIASIPEPFEWAKVEMIP